MDTAPRNNDPASRFFAEHIQKHLEAGYDPKLARIFGEQELLSLTIDEYVERIKESGSGHLAVHNAKREFLDLILKKGYLSPTMVARAFARTEGDKEGESFRQANYLGSSTALHFSIDEPFIANGDIALVVAIEAILENKSFLSIPIASVGERGTGNDMTVSGNTEDPEDQSNKFFIDALGILFIPKSARFYMATRRPILRNENWNEEENPTLSANELISILRKEGVPVPRRIYFYDGDSIQKGIQQFLKEKGLLMPSKDKKITSSAPVVPKYKRGNGQFSHFDPQGRGQYFSVKKKLQKSSETILAKPLDSPETSFELTVNEVSDETEREEILGKYFSDESNVKRIIEGYGAVYEGKPLISEGFTECSAVVAISEISVSLSHVPPVFVPKDIFNIFAKYFPKSEKLRLISIVANLREKNEMGEHLRGKGWKIVDNENISLELEWEKQMWSVAVDPEVNSIFIKYRMSSADPYMVKRVRFQSSYNSTLHQESQAVFEASDYMPVGFRNIQKIMENRGYKVSEWDCKTMVDGFNKTPLQWIGGNHKIRERIFVYHEGVVTEIDIHSPQTILGILKGLVKDLNGVYLILTFDEKLENHIGSASLYQVDLRYS